MAQDSLTSLPETERESTLGLCVWFLFHHDQYMMLFCEGLQKEIKRRELRRMWQLVREWELRGMQFEPPLE